MPNYETKNVFYYMIFKILIFEYILKYILNLASLYDIAKEKFLSKKSTKHVAWHGN